MISTTKRAFWLFTLILISMSFTLCFAQDDVILMDKNRIVKTYDMNSGGDLSVKNISGDIKIESWNKNSIEIEIVKRGRRDDIEVYIDRRENNVNIEVEYPDNSWNNRRGNRNRSGSIFFTIKLPEKTGIEAESVSGDVFVYNIKAPVEAATVSGDVEIQNIEGDTYGKSVSGYVELYNIAGEIEAGSVSGDIEILKSKCNDLDAKTVSGDVEVETSVIDVNGRYRCETHSGDIILSIPGEAKADITAKAPNRNFTSDFDLEDRNKRSSGRNRNRRNYSDSFNFGPRTFEGRINGGGARINLSTFSGEVDIRKNR